MSSKLNILDKLVRWAILMSATRKNLNPILVLSRAAQQYIVIPIYCTIYFIVQYNIIYCKAKKNIVLFLLLLGLQYIDNILLSSPGS